MRDGKPTPVPGDEIFQGKTVALFALPGAFTPTCSAKHVPGYVQNHDALKAKGVDTIVCVSVNDAFVMGAWGKDQGAGNKVMMLADGNGDFTRAVGLEFDASKFRHGQAQPARYSMLVKDGGGQSPECGRAGRVRRVQRRAHVVIGPVGRAVRPAVSRAQIIRCYFKGLCNLRAVLPRWRAGLNQLLCGPQRF